MFALTILAFIQIITESLPISSSTHVRIAQSLMRRAGLVVPTFTESFEHFLHLPTLVVVVVALLYWYGGVVLPTLRALRQTSWRGRVLRTAAGRTTGMIIVSTAITVVGYYLLQKKIIICPWDAGTGLAITAGLLFASRGQEGSSAITWGQSALLGGVQALALCPGVSRLGATYAVGRMCGWRPRRSLTYSFVLQLVLVSGAVVRAITGSELGSIALGFADVLFLGSASVGALLLLLWIMRLTQRRQLWWFAWYLVGLDLIAVFCRLLVLKSN